MLLLISILFNAFMMAMIFVVTAQLPDSKLTSVALIALISLVSQ